MADISDRDTDLIGVGDVGHDQVTGEQREAARAREVWGG